ncbi:MAG: 30S ribosomal protein S8 [Candidatus Micrarchaeia archaeon]
MVDLLADALNIIKVMRNSGRDECKIPASKMIGAVLQILQKEEYIKEFEFVDDGKSGFYLVKGIGAINECGVIKPRFAVKYVDITKAEEQYLPSKDFGILIVSTPKGIVTNQKLREMKSGGRLIAYFY